MPFASLTPAKQKFLSSYFKPKTFFKKGTTDEKKDKMADELIAFQKARDLAALQITKLAPSGVDVSPLLAELKAADAIAADPQINARCRGQGGGRGVIAENPESQR